MHKRLKTLFWHVHGGYLYYLGHTNLDLYVVKSTNGIEVSGGLPDGGYDWPRNLKEINSREAANQDFDLIVLQSENNLFHDQYEVFGDRVRQIPKLYLEHDPPKVHPTDTRHPAVEAGIPIVHVTHFNALMWDNGNLPIKVIEHGIVTRATKPNVKKKKKGITLVNNIDLRGRRLGLDVFETVRKSIPLDIAGIGTERIGGLGEIDHRNLPEFLSQYSFFFNPIRYTSMGLSVCEAMAYGLPIIGMQTTDMSRYVHNEINGYLSNSVGEIVEFMEHMKNDTGRLEEMGTNSMNLAKAYFNIKQFSDKWEEVSKEAIEMHRYASNSYKVMTA